ncbi:MAG TPA: ATP-binding cassette domain-containing protein [Candidatus Absconditabacterales bacterium]|nr:ATP-binding cassette domain-containing protein [Candidatus Absconditabacterales bacterium]
MLSIYNLTSVVQGKTVLSHIKTQFVLGEHYCLLGRNGSGKSSLAMSIMGNPAYECSFNDAIGETIDNQTPGIWMIDEESFFDEVTKRSLIDHGINDLNRINISELGVDMRAKLGIFVAFQTIPQIPGVKLFEFLRIIYNARWGTSETFLSFKKIIEPLCQELMIERDFLRRDVNVGFSGGERRKIEILQLQILKPRYIFLDEVDSGLDVDAFKSIAQILSAYRSSTNTFVIITHYFDILEYIPVDHVYLMDGGMIISKGDMSMASTVKEHGFETLLSTTIKQ